MSERRVALITGAAKRLGRHLAGHLAGKGFHVLINYQSSQQEADALVSEVQQAGGSARAVRADISAKGQVADMFADLTQREGSLDLLINNVGNYTPGPIQDLSPDMWDECISANLSGAYYCCYEARTLLEATGGQIVNIGYAGLDLNPATPGAVAYQVSKVGLLSMTRSLAVALAPSVRVNMLSPGQLDDSIDLPSDLASAIPLGRAGSHEDIASALDFLLDASYVTGQNLDVAGGYRLGGS
jgi:3-oxoacyl-[acyl-carrier protein] reductase